ncbi:MAG: hypothetical protein V3T72_17155 [Thermoanaerobaculia bacterium]
MRALNAGEKPDTEARLRTALALIMVFGIVGVATELALLGHYEEWRQWTPLVLLGAGLLSVAGAALNGSAKALALHLGVMVGFLTSGLAGIWFHYRGNVEFEVEMVPSIGGWELFKEAMTGATPALAPGTMILLGLVGLALSYRHPASRPRTNIESGKEPR